MNIGFHLLRDNYIKLFAPLIEYLLTRKCSVTIFCDYRQRPADLGYKIYMYPYVDKIPKFGSPVDVVSFKETVELSRLIIEKKIQAVFFINFDPICIELKKILRKEDYDFLSAELQVFLELFMTAKDLSYSDVIYTFSDDWKVWWEAYLEHHEVQDRDRFIQDIHKRCKPVGFPEADQCKSFDQKYIHKKYDIPEEKKVIVLFPFPWRIPFGTWTHVVYQPQNLALKIARLLYHRSLEYLPDVREGIDDFRLSESIRQFADANDAIFLVKGRLKNKIPRYLSQMADRVFLDESYYPFTTLELMSVADLSISFYSASIMESILARTPTICIAPKGGGSWPGYEDRALMADFSSNPGSFYRFEGVVYYETADRFMRTFQYRNFEDYAMDHEKADRYTKKFLGFSDYNASQRIYEDLVRRMGGRGDLEMT